MEDPFTILESFINEKKPGYIIKKVSANGLCVTHPFQERLICY